MLYCVGCNGLAGTTTSAPVRYGGRLRAMWVVLGWLCELPQCKQCVHELLASWYIVVFASGPRFHAPVQPDDTTLAHPLQRLILNLRPVPSHLSLRLIHHWVSLKHCPDVKPVPSVARTDYITFSPASTKMKRRIKTQIGWMYQFWSCLAIF